MWNVERWGEYMAGLSREVASAQARAQKDNTRDARISVLARAIDEGIRSAPDLFEGRIDARRAATLVVDDVWEA